MHKEHFEHYGLKDPHFLSIRITYLHKLHLGCRRKKKNFLQQKKNQSKMYVRKLEDPACKRYLAFENGDYYRNVILI